MADQRCEACPTLRAQIRALERQNRHLAQTLTSLRAAVSSQVRGIGSELDERTMTRDDLVKRVHARLLSALVAAGGRA